MSVNNVQSNSFAEFLQYQTTNKQIKPKNTNKEQVDFADLSYKKTCINTGIGTGIGAFIGVLLGYFNSNSQNVNSVEENVSNVSQKTEEEITKEFRDKLSSGINKLINGEKLTKEEAKLIHDLELDTPYKKYNNCEFLKDVLSDLKEHPNDNPLHWERTKLIEHNLTYNTKLLDVIRAYLKGEEPNKNVKIIKDIFEADYRTAGNLPNINLMDMIKSSFDEEADYEKFKKTGKAEYVATRIGVLSEKLPSPAWRYHDDVYEYYIEENLKKVENTVKTDSKKIIKTVGKGALIAGSLALLGTITMNKYNKQNINR